MRRKYYRKRNGELNKLVKAIAANATSSTDIDTIIKDFSEFSYKKDQFKLRMKQGFCWIGETLASEFSRGNYTEEFKSLTQLDLEIIAVESRLTGWKKILGKYLEDGKYLARLIKQLIVNEKQVFARFHEVFATRFDAFASSEYRELEFTDSDHVKGLSQLVAPSYFNRSSGRTAQEIWQSMFAELENYKFPEIVFSSEADRAIAYREKFILELKKIQSQLKRKERLAKAQSLATKNTSEQRDIAGRFRTNKHFKAQLVKSRACPFCALNFRQETLSSEVHLDHIYPVSRGGKSVISNLAFICGPCNRKKSDKTLHRFCESEGYDLSDVSGRLLKLGKDV